MRDGVALLAGGVVMLVLRFGNILVKWVAARLGVEETVPKLAGGKDSETP